MGGDEGDLTESSRADADNEKRKQIVDILVTWFQSTPGSSVEILEFLKVCSLGRTYIQKMYSFNAKLTVTREFNHTSK